MFTYMNFYETYNFYLKFLYIKKCIIRSKSIIIRSFIIYICKYINYYIKINCHKIYYLNLYAH